MRGPWAESVALYSTTPTLPAAAWLYQSHQPFESCFRLERNHCVAQSSKAVHPMGYPISHSTHIGLNVPPTATGSGVPPGWAFAPLVTHLIDFASLAVGVGHSFTAPARVHPPPVPIRRLRAIVSRLGRTLPDLPAEPPKFVPYELAAGVGKEEPSLAEVRGANLLG